MQDFFNFIKTNYRLIIDVVILIISIVVFILRKPSKNTILDSSATFDLVNLVQQAEKKYGSGNGYKKLRFVIESYCQLKGLTPTDEVFRLVKSLVEKILSTPQKK